jgi:uncharacterized protein (TIGR03437 family)
VRAFGTIILSFISFVAAYAAPPAACGPNLVSGFQIVNVPNQPGGSNYPTQTQLRMAMWYPSVANTATYLYSNSSTASISGVVALNAPLTDCGAGIKFPLVIFSHGWSGCGTQSVFLTEELARRGYIVAAPDHADHGCSVDSMGSQDLSEANFAFPFQQFGDPSSWTDETGNYRNVDIKTILDWILLNSPWKDRIDPDRIGMAGHSFGGYTAFAKIGGWASWLDGRLKAAIMYSPYIQAFWAQTPSAVSNPTVPQMFLGGTADVAITPWIKGTQKCSPTCSPGAFQQAQFPKYFGELGTLGTTSVSQAGHLAFSNNVCTAAQSFTTVQACLTNVQNAQLIVNYSSDFWDRYLQGQSPQRLWSSGTGWNTYWRTGGIPAGSYQAGASGAPGEIASVQGELLTQAATQYLESASYPVEVMGYKVWVTDASDTRRAAPIQYISPTQINFVVPAETQACAPGGASTCQAQVDVEGPDGGFVASGPFTIASLAPSLFVSYPDHWVSGWAQNGTGTFFPIWDASGTYPSANVSSGDIFIVLMGTGIGFNANPAATATIAGVPVTVVYAVHSGQYQGVDQIALGPVPKSLAGKGRVPVRVTVGGQTSNVGWISIQ